MFTFKLSMLNHRADPTVVTGQADTYQSCRAAHAALPEHRVLSKHIECDSFVEFDVIDPREGPIRCKTIHGSATIECPTR